MASPTYLGAEIIFASQDNFVCNARCMVEDKTFVSSGIGCSPDEAEKAAKSNLNTLVNNAQHNTNGATNYNQQKAGANDYKQVDKSSFNGGGNKPITDSQINFICSLANQKKMDPDDLPKRRFGKPLDELIGSEANEVINILKEHRNEVL